MRVVSLVPSWTETLLQSGVQVVGRTRYCVHPHERVQDIPIVGGTKDWDLPRILALQPELLILDREENPKFMSEGHPIPTFASHVTAVTEVAVELRKLASLLGREGDPLTGLAARWEALLRGPRPQRWQPGVELPGLIQWGREPAVGQSIRCVIYMIWRSPWMTVSRDTFIGSVLDFCGLGSYLRRFPTRYPEVDLNDLVAGETLILFSSEPYPFLRKREVLNPIHHAYAFVDGESFSWFGVRTLEFLERIVRIAEHVE